jgi:hypothetical protein
VPQWYLRRWSSGDDEVCVLDWSGFPSLVKIGRAGADRDGYTIFSTDGTRDDSIELQRLQEVDAHGSTTTASFLKNGKLSGPVQQKQFARFVGWLIMRGPALAGVLDQSARDLNAARGLGLLDEKLDVLGSSGVARGGDRLRLPLGAFTFSRDDGLELLRSGIAPDAKGAHILHRKGFWGLRRLSTPLLQTCDNPVLSEDEVPCSPEVAAALYLPLAPDALFWIGAPHAPVPDVVTWGESTFAEHINALIDASAISQRYLRPPLLGSG